MFRRKFATISLAVWFILWSIPFYSEGGVTGVLFMIFMMGTPAMLAAVATEEQLKNDRN
jgi:hypothetical protein